MSLKDYQENLRQLLQNKFQSETTSEWMAGMRGESYSPRLDIAVGPYSIEDGTSLIDKYDQLFDIHITTIREMARLHLLNIGQIDDKMSSEKVDNELNYKLGELQGFNFNSRCFIAVEIENEVSRKHLMGGAINASVLGRIAIVIGYTEEKHNAFKRLYEYFQFLQSVEKPTFRTNNLLVISPDQIMNILQ